jgi:hypothetical protein
LAIRVALLVVLALALAGLRLGSTPAAQALVMAVDRSASVLGGLGTEAGTATGALRAKGGGDQVGIVSFGQDAEVEAPVSERPRFTSFATQPDPNFTDIESALRLAGSVMPPGMRHHVLLVSDGRQNVGDAVRQARLLRSQGVRIDVLPVPVPSGPDVRVDDVIAPANVPKGSSPQVRVDLVSNVATSGRLRIEVDGGVVFDHLVRTLTGQTSLTAVLPPATAGTHTIRALIDPASDSITENNFGEAVYQVLGAQRVLVVEGQPGEGANVAAALRAASIDVITVAPSLVPRTATDVGAYQAVALVNVSAAQLGTERMTAIATATKALGTGLAAFGGTNTFGPGGLAGTPLEQALPIDMQIPNRNLKPPVAVVLVLESVENSAGDEVVRSAARSLVANLRSSDLVGVTDALGGFAVPLQPLTDSAKVQSAIANIPSFGDPISYVPYLNDAARALAAHPTATKHIIILGDGDTPELPTPGFMASLVHQGITVTAVGVNVDGNPQFMANMSNIASEGDGRYYQSDSAGQVPDIFLDETRTSLQPWIVRQRFLPSLGSPSQALAGVDPETFPALDGYVSATPKASAQVVLGGPNGDPVLAQWTYGAGLASAWTSDTDGRWTASLLDWPEAGRLLAGIVASTLPLTPDPGLQVGTTIDGDQLHVLVQMPNPPPSATVLATVVKPDGTSTRVDLVGTGPGRYEGDAPAVSVGVYPVHVTVGSEGRTVAASTAGASVSYSPEYRFIGTDPAVLAAIATAGGGLVLTSPDQAFSVPVSAVRVEHSLAAWLLGMAAVGLALDVALRRLTLRRSDAEVWAGALRGVLPARSSDGTDDDAQGDPNLARLRRRVEAVRRGPHPSSAAGAAPVAEEDLAARLLSRRGRDQGRDAEPGDTR